MNYCCHSVEVTAVCDINPDKLEKVKEYKDTAKFTDSNKMLDSGLIDAVLIAVSHYDHPTIAIEAFRRKIHVFIEKLAGILQFRQPESDL